MLDTDFTKQEIPPLKFGSFVDSEVEAAFSSDCFRMYQALSRELFIMFVGLSLILAPMHLFGFTNLGEGYLAFGIQLASALIGGLGLWGMRKVSNARMLGLLTGYIGTLLYVLFYFITHMYMSDEEQAITILEASLIFIMFNLNVLLIWRPHISTMMMLCIFNAVCLFSLAYIHQQFSGIRFFFSCVMFFSIFVFIIKQANDIKRAKRKDWWRTKQLYSTQAKLMHTLGELEQLSLTDSLTKVANRLHLDRRLGQEFHRSHRYQNSFSLIMCDLDQFEKVNDEYGHLIADKVLAEVSRIIRQNVRSVDFLGRWGGKEFMIICPETDAKGVLQVAENVRLAVAAHDFNIGKKVTMSFGVASYRVGDSSETLVNRTGQSLYMAKNNGKNCVVSA